jgi:hypothetical protein
MPSENGVKQAVGLLQNYTDWQGPNIINTHKVGAQSTKKLAILHAAQSYISESAPVCFHGIKVSDILIPNRETGLDQSKPVQHIISVLATALDERHKNGQCETGFIDFDFIHAKIEEALIEVELANAYRDPFDMLDNIPQEIRLPGELDPNKDDAPAR